MYRQGDLLIIPIGNGAHAWLGARVGLRPVAREDGRVVLAHGEVTGHSHAIADSDVELWEREKAATAEAADRYLRVGAGGATVVHEEHAPITLPPGDYAVRLQTTFDPVGEEERARARWLED